MIEVIVFNNYLDSHDNHVLDFIVIKNVEKIKSNKLRTISGVLNRSLVDKRRWGLVMNFIFIFPKITKFPWASAPPVLICRLTFDS